MICETCKAQGLKSCVYPGQSTVTLMGWSPYYDEKGELHSHDPNWHTTSYRCSNGHEWTENIRRPCWCGWPEKKGDQP